ncbi:MAG: DegT/DnrJ/EryC1/StrS family aminotransferase [Deltaproteobacteria bacterium]|nr:DegT/DnrJ/EryC1/StrS family aminotransferase [Deltaproteobacteria bacterium]
MRVPFVDLKAQYQTISGPIQDAIAKVIGDTAFIRGKYVEEFEANFAKFCGAKFCLGVGNGTDALFIALRALGIGQGDEVIVPANSFIATSEAVTMAGARVVFAEVDPITYNIDPAQIAAKITPRTKAIIPVHLYGQPADLPTICDLAAKHGLKVVQDCAQAHGAAIQGKPLAAYGDMLAFSFYPGKNLGAYGDAGAVLTNDAGLADRAKMFANHGRISKYDHEFEAVNSRMDGIQGAILNVKLAHLDEWTEGRRRNAAVYDELLHPVPGITTPGIVSGNRHVYHLYVIRSGRRDALAAYLKENGIETGVHYPIALPNLMAYKYLGHSPADFPISSRYQSEILSLPMYAELTREMAETVVRHIKDFCSK